MNIRQDKEELILHSRLVINGTLFICASLDKVSSGGCICFNVFFKTEAARIRAYQVLGKEGKIVQVDGR